MTTKLNEKISLAYRKGLAEGRMKADDFVQVADYPILIMYQFDYYYLINKYLVEYGIAEQDADIEHYSNHVTVGSRTIPYDVRNVDTEDEVLLLWL